MKDVHLKQYKIIWGKAKLYVMLFCNFKMEFKGILKS